MHRLDALLEILGPDWIAAVGSAMTITMLHLLSRWPDPHQVIRLGSARLALWLRRQSRDKWGAEQAEAIIQAAQATFRLWGHDGMDFGALAADIALEAQLAGAYQQSCPLGALCRGATFEVTAISGGTAMSVGP